METLDTLDELLMKKYEAEYDKIYSSLPSLFNRLRAGGTLLFDNVYYIQIMEYFDADPGSQSIITYKHQCGSQGGRYRISKKGTCYKCKKMIGSYKQLDTIRGLKALTDKEEKTTIINWPYSGDTPGIYKV